METKKKLLPPLTDQIETIIEPSADTLDNDTLAFLNDFLSRFNQTAPLEPFDLTTPESARKAAAMLAKRQEEIQAMLKNARALKNIIR